MMEDYIQTKSLEDVLDYVSRQVTCFRFPDIEGLKSQYGELRRTWGRLLSAPAIAQEHC